MPTIRESVAETANNNDWIFHVDHVTATGAEEVHYNRENVKVVVCWAVDGGIITAFRQHNGGTPEIARGDAYRQLSRLMVWLQEWSSARHIFVTERNEEQMRERRERRAEEARITIEDLRAARSRMMSDSLDISAEPTPDCILTWNEAPGYTRQSDWVVLRPLDID